MKKEGENQESVVNVVFLVKNEYMHKNKSNTMLKINSQQMKVKQIGYKEVLKIDDILVESNYEGNSLYMVEGIEQDHVVARTGKGELIKLFFATLDAKKSHFWLSNAKRNILIHYMLDI